MRDDSEPITQAFWRLRVIYQHATDPPKFSTAKATIQHIRHDVRQGKIPISSPWGGSHAAHIGRKDCVSGKLRVSARTLTCPGPNGSRIWRNICCSKVAVDLILEEAACGIAAFNLERQAAGRLLNRFPVSAKMRLYVVRLRLNVHHLARIMHRA